MLHKIGDVEVWRLLEINAPFMPPQDLFTNTDVDIIATIEKHAPGSICATSGCLILPIQGFLLKTPQHVILVDGCVGNHKTHPRDPDWHHRDDDRFVASLSAAGVGFNDVDYVLCTHLHADHVGWNTKLEDGRWVPTFPNARYLMPVADEEMQRSRDGEVYHESILPVIKAKQAELVQADHMLGDHVSLIPTPGHTPGHVSVAIKSGDEHAIITGDALHTTVQCWHPEWHFLYDSDKDQAAQSRRSLLEHSSETGCVVLGSHFALPSLGRITAEKDAFRWIKLGS